MKKYEDFCKDVDDYMSEHPGILPDNGEGETLGNQAFTAVNRIIYKWYNDGDIFDNVKTPLVGWANDLSSYANWLFTQDEMDNEYVQEILDGINDVATEKDYENLIQELFYTVTEWIDEKDLLNKPKVGTIDECKGPFEFRKGYDGCINDEDDYEGDEED